MRNLKKLPASLVITLALFVSTSAGIIECPPPAPPPDSSSIVSQSEPTIEPTSTETARLEDDNSSLETMLSLLESAALTLF